MSGILLNSFINFPTISNQKTAVIRNTLNVTPNGTTDFTSAGFGTVKAAIVFCNHSTAVENPKNNATMCIGFFDGSTQCSNSIFDNDGNAKSQTARMSSSQYIVTLINEASIEAKYTASSITDGIRITCSENAANLEDSSYVTVLLLGGDIVAKVGTLLVNGTLNGTTNSPSLGFAPKVVIAGSTNLSSSSWNTSTPNIMLRYSFGIAEINGTHRAIAYEDYDNTNDGDVTVMFSENRFIKCISNQVEAWGAEMTAWGSDTFTLTSRDFGQSPDVQIAYLALGGTALSYDIGTLTTPTSGTPTQATTTSIAPKALLLTQTLADSTSLLNDSRANGFCHGIANSTDEYSHSMYIEDASATMHSGSISNDSNVLNLDSISGGTRTDVVTASVAFDSDSFDLTYSLTDATARKGWWVVFG